MIIHLGIEFAQVDYYSYHIYYTLELYGRIIYVYMHICIHIKVFEMLMALREQNDLYQKELLDQRQIDLQQHLHTVAVLRREKRRESKLFSQKETQLQEELQSLTR